MGDAEKIVAQLTFHSDGALTYRRTLFVYDASGQLGEGAVLTYRGSWAEEEEGTYAVTLSCAEVKPGPYPGYGPQTCEDYVARNLVLVGDCVLDGDTLSCGPGEQALRPLSMSCAEGC